MDKREKELKEKQRSDILKRKKKLKRQNRKVFLSNRADKYQSK